MHKRCSKHQQIQYSARGMGATKFKELNTWASWSQQIQFTTRYLMHSNQITYELKTDWLCLEALLTVSEFPSRRMLIALVTSSLQSCSATIHSSWFFPVTSISCRRDKKQAKTTSAQDFHPSFRVFHENLLKLLRYNVSSQTGWWLRGCSSVLSCF